MSETRSLENYRHIGRGSYNEVYTDEKEVIKIPQKCNKSGDEYHEDDLKLDKVERAVRLWNAINPSLSPRAQVVTVKKDSLSLSAWTCPYIEGEQASVEEICNALMDIYNRTGRIVVDACVHGNFITMENGRVVCVDVGLALQLEEREMIFSDPTRCRSEASLLRVDAHLINDIKYFEKECNSKIIDLLKALILIKYNRPDIQNVDFLKNHEEVITKLASVFHEGSISSALIMLDKIYQDSQKPRFDFKLFGTKVKAVVDNAADFANAFCKAKYF